MAGPATTKRQGRPACTVAVAMLAMCVAAIATAQAPALPAARDEASVLLRQAEDARGATDAQRTWLRHGLTHPDVAVRLQATRAVGRLEDPAWLPDLGIALDDPSIEIRAEAAWAVAQVASTSVAATDAARRLGERLTRETDVIVRATLATNLGRLPFEDGTTADAVANRLGGLIPGPESAGASASPLLTLGVARGVHALARRCGTRTLHCPATIALLARLHHDHRPARTSAVPAVATRVRRLAALGLQSIDAIDDQLGPPLLLDDDAEVRRAAVPWAARAASTTLDVARRLAGDASSLVRHAFVVHGGERWPVLARAALDDQDPDVRLAALDALGAAGACGCDAALNTASDDPSGWHTFAHALVATARSRSDTARPALERAMASPVWQVRMYAARAAGALPDVASLRELARDMHPNVREAALTALDALGHRGSDDLRREALTSGDYQLVLTAARGLEGTSDPEAAGSALFEALRRLTADRRDTSRDPRLALIDRLGDVLGPVSIARLDPWRRDEDPVVAARAAAVMSAVSGRPAAAASPPKPASPREPAPIPEPSDIAAREHMVVVLTLHGDGEVVIRPMLGEAPLNALRFMRQVEAGQWDGLTFHRVEPGFVVQGGSPGANEYVGADRYTRDERGPLSHVRGTVGISTRGRDTGDGQIFVNLVDNPRLDFAYTIIGQVVTGMPAVDAMLKGAVIERARVEQR